MFNINTWIQYPHYYQHSNVVVYFNDVGWLFVYVDNKIPYTYDVAQDYKTANIFL